MSGTTDTTTTTTGPTDLASQQGLISTALKAGYSPQDIVGHLQSSNSDLGQKVQQATAAGYAPGEIVEHMSPGIDTAKPMNIGAALGDGWGATDIANYLAANPHRAPVGATGQPYNVAAALQDGHSAADIIDHLNSNVRGSSSQGIPVLAPVARGIAHAEEGAANLADDFGFTGVGSGIRSRIIQSDLSAPQSGTGLINDIKAGHYGAALTDLPSAALEQALPLGAGVGAGAAAPLLGIGAAAGALGTGALLGAGTQGDAIARARAANNGEAAPSAGDLAIGLGAGAGIGALQSVGQGTGGSLAALAGRVSPQVEKILSSFLGRNAQQLGADAAMPQAQSLASTAGTNVGAQGVDLSQSIAAAATGAATRAGLAGATKATTATADTVNGLRPSVQTAKDAATFNDADDAGKQDLLNQAAAAQLVKTYQTGSDDPLVRSDFSVAARTAKNDLAGQVHSYIGNLSDQGYLGDQDLDTIKTALSNATNSQRVLSQTEHLDPIQDLNVPDEVKDNLTQAISQVNLLSNAGVQSRATGPFQIGLGAAGGFLGSKAVGGHYSPAGFAMHRVGSGIGGAVGGFIDGKMGLSTPALAKAGSDASDAITAAGQEVPDTLGTIKAASGQSYDIAQAQLDAIQKAASDQSTAIQMNRQFDKDTAAGQADARAQYQAMLRDAYSTNQQANQIDAAHQQMEAALAARSNTADSAGNWMERQLLSKFKGANPDVPVTGAAVLSVKTPDQVFAATGGRFGNPAGDAPNMTGIPAQGTPQPVTQPVTSASQAAPQQAPAPVQQPVMGPSTDPIAQAQARAQAMGLLQGSRQPASASGALAPQGLQALAQKLPDYVQGLGSDLRTHLVASGQAQPINDMLEVNKALGQLKDSGVINQALHDAIKGHNGRLMEPVYNALRNQMLLNYGINRTVY